MKQTTIKVTGEWLKGSKFFRVTEIAPLTTKIEMVNVNDEIISEFPLMWTRTFDESIGNIQFMVAQIKGTMEIIR